MNTLGSKHINYLTDDFGIWQHCRYYKIDEKNGYSLDDNARALIVAILYGERKKAKIYVNFLDRAISEEKIVNFFGQDREPWPNRWSEDALGQAFWALSFCRHKGILKNKCQAILERFLFRIRGFQTVRGKAYVLAASKYIENDLVKKFALDLVRDVGLHATKRWFWPEAALRYGNAIIPFSLLCAAEKLNNKYLEANALALLIFLNKKTIKNGIAVPIGNMGWHQKGGKKARFDQQPIDPAYSIIANIKAHEMTGDEEFLLAAKINFDWFWGKNISNQQMINIKSQSCYDGIGEEGVNRNQGAENIVCYLMAQEAIWEQINNC